MQKIQFSEFTIKPHIFKSLILISLHFDADMEKSLHKAVQVYSLDIRYPIFYNSAKTYLPMNSEDFAKFLWKI
ncbi:MAG: hypothetical protein B6D35_01315 [Candidatus Brocadia sp. UTAMX2]|jgi:hypothetical protein|nr:MAG: hypothetical protein B6D35_01315 [Candidatus Brocadia sp. UTAMX2]